MRAHHEQCSMPQALCELHVRASVSNDGSEKTGTEAGGQGLSRFSFAVGDKMFCSVFRFWWHRERWYLKSNLTAADRSWQRQHGIRYMPICQISNIHRHTRTHTVNDTPSGDFHKKYRHFILKLISFQSFISYYHDPCNNKDCFNVDAVSVLCHTDSSTK